MFLVIPGFSTQATWRVRCNKALYAKGFEDKTYVGRVITFRQPVSCYLFMLTSKYVLHEIPCSEWCRGFQNSTTKRLMQVCLVNSKVFFLETKQSAE